MFKVLLIVLAILAVASAQSIRFVNAVPQTITVTIQGQSSFSLTTGQVSSYTAASVDGITVTSITTSSGANLLSVPALITPTGSGFTTVGVVLNPSGNVTLPFFDDGNTVVAGANNAIVKVISFVNTTITVNYVSGGTGSVFTNVAYLQETNYASVAAGSTFSITDTRSQTTTTVTGPAITAQNAYSIFYLPGTTNTATIVFDRVANSTALTTAAITSGSTTSAITSGSTSAEITSGSTSAEITSGSTTAATTGISTTIVSGVSTSASMTSSAVITSGAVTTSRVTTNAATTSRATTSTTTGDNDSSSFAVKNVVGLVAFIFAFAFAF